MRSLAGTGTLTGMALRRDRVMLVAWAYAVTALVVGTAYSFKKLYPTPASQQRFAATIGRGAAFLALYGQLYGSSVGALTTWRILSGAALLAGIMVVFIVVRHTRAEEEAGRLELVGAAAVGRQAALTSALLTAFGASLVLAALIALGLIVVGLPAAGAFGFGVVIGSAGWVFAAVAATVAQVTESARLARGLAITVVAAAYLLRDISSAVAGLHWLWWLSPIGWAEQVRPFSTERWWPVGLAVAATSVAATAAYAISARRDLNAGLLQVRPGPENAAGWLRDPFMLAWRLQRAGLAGWVAGFAAGGAVVGALAASVGSLVGTSSQLGQVLTKLGGSSEITNAYLAGIIGFFGLVAAAYAVAATLRLRTEETEQRADVVLAAAVGRIRWAASHLVIAAAGPVILLAAAGSCAGSADALRSGHPGQVGVLLGAALAQVPAAWVLVGIAMAFFGFLPRLQAGAWAALVVFLVCGLLGSVLRLPQWAMDVSPFTHVPKIPGAVFTLTPLIWLAVVAVLLVVAGLTGLRERDIG